MNPKQALIYVRVSTSEQADKGVSLDNQERACLEWAFRNQIQALKVFREEGKSGKTLNRPEMQAMLEYLSDHFQEIDYIIVYQIDRLTRSLFDFTDFMKLLVQYKVQLRDSASNMEASESDELIQSLHAVLAQHDNRLKSKRVIENMKRHAAQGYRMHKAPYGLRNIRDEIGRPTVRAIEPTASNIAYILMEFAKGTFTKRQLLHEARKVGLTQPNGKPLSYQLLDKMLRKPLYAGLEQSNFTEGQLVSSVFEGIVPEWVFHSNQTLLNSRKNHKLEGYSIISPDYPLRKFLICTKCNQPIRGSASTGRGGKKYPRYHCTSLSCHSAYIKPDDMHNIWQEQLSQLQPNDKRLKLLQTVILRVWREEVHTMRFRQKQLRERIDTLSEEKIDAAEMLVAGELTGEEKSALIDRLKKQIGTLQGQLVKLDRRIGTKEEAIDYAVNYIGNAKEMWNTASPEMKQIYQRMIYPEGLPFNLKTKQFGTAKISHLYTLASIKKDPSASEESLLVSHLTSNWNHICSEINQWYDTLRSVPKVEAIPAGSRT